jgi:hypothetical protein
MSRGIGPVRGAFYGFARVLTADQAVPSVAATYAAAPVRARSGPPHRGLRAKSDRATGDQRGALASPRRQRAGDWGLKGQRRDHQRVPTQSLDLESLAPAPPEPDRHRASGTRFRAGHRPTRLRISPRTSRRRPQRPRRVRTGRAVARRSRSGRRPSTHQQRGPQRRDAFIDAFIARRSRFELCFGADVVGCGRRGERFRSEARGVALRGAIEFLCHRGLIDRASSKLRPAMR